MFYQELYHKSFRYTQRLSWADLSLLQQTRPPQNLPLHLSWTTWKETVPFYRKLLSLFGMAGAPILNTSIHGCFYISPVSPRLTGLLSVSLLITLLSPGFVLKFLKLGLWKHNWVENHSVLGWHFFSFLYLVGNLPPEYRVYRKRGMTLCPSLLEPHRGASPKAKMSSVPPESAHRAAVSDFRTVTEEDVLLRSNAPVCTLVNTPNTWGEGGISEVVPMLLPPPPLISLALSPQTRAQLLSPTAQCYLGPSLETPNFHLTISGKTILGLSEIWPKNKQVKVGSEQDFSEVKLPTRPAQ